MASSDDNILAKEIESWKGFESALHKQYAETFNKMLSECLENREYASAFKTRRLRIHRIIVYSSNISTTKNDK